MILPLLLRTGSAVLLSPNDHAGESTRCRYRTMCNEAPTRVVGSLTVQPAGIAQQI